MIDQTLLPYAIGFVLLAGLASLLALAVIVAVATEGRRGSGATGGVVPMRAADPGLVAATRRAA